MAQKEEIDDARIVKLMGHMPSRSDSIAWNGRINFWKKAIVNWSKNRNGITFKLSDTEMAFQKGTQVPKCFKDIFENLLKNGDLISTESFYESCHTNLSWVEWSRRTFMINPSKWIWSTINQNFFGSTLYDRTFIHADVLNERSQAIYDLCWKADEKESFTAESIVSFDELYRLLNTDFEYKITSDDLLLVLHFLALKNRLVLSEHNGMMIIKFARPGFAEIDTMGSTELAQFDLRENQRKLEDRLSDLNKEIEQLKENAKHFLKNGHKNKALSLLRRKRACEQSSDNVFNALENVLACRDKLKETTLNQEILISFQVGLNALKSTMAKSSVVDSTMDDLQDALEQCQEIGDSLGLNQSLGESTELEDELSQLMSLNEIRSDAEDDLLPDTPSHDPFSPKTADKIKPSQIEF